ncbi:MAG TPA: phosphoribosylglycinamide formyltransferase [Vulgatibacter sp.]|nr:phosphoribosylglycinamide formyltransferase [Vulgatibacter sp.]
MLSLAVLASGSGTNLAALLGACASGRIAAKVSVVVCNVPGARALERARDAGVPAVLLDHAAFPDRPSFEAALDAELSRRGIDLVILAGFMRMLGAAFVEKWEGRIVNVHPSLLPSFPGLAAPRQALAAGVRISGCTVHVVDAGQDTGPILAQAAVPVLPDDTEESLRIRIQAQEHLILPHAIGLIADGKVRLEGRRVIYERAVDGSCAAKALACPEPEVR